MAKLKSAFYCQSCGTQFAKWQGQCTACKEWNTIAEELVAKPEKSDWKVGTQVKTKNNKSLLIHEIDSTKEARLDTNNVEFNRVLGGGLVPGSLTLLGGETRNW